MFGLWKLGSHFSHFAMGAIDPAVVELMIEENRMKRARMPATAKGERPFAEAANAPCCDDDREAA